jgi:hypothetical protein
MALQRERPAPIVACPAFVHTVDPPRLSRIREPNVDWRKHS